MVNLARVGQTLVEARGDTDVHVVRYAWRKGRKTNRTISPLVFLRTAETEQLYQVKRMTRGIGHALFSTYSQT